MIRFYLENDLLLKQLMMIKNICQIEHSRHRSFTNFLSKIVAGLIAYSFLPKKPTIKYHTIKTNQLAFY